MNSSAIKHILSFGTLTKQGIIYHKLRWLEICHTAWGIASCWPSGHRLKTPFRQGLAPTDLTELRAWKAFKGLLCCSHLSAMQCIMPKACVGVSKVSHSWMQLAFRGVKWLSGKPFGMETPTQGLLPAASKETQDLSSAPWSLEEEETNVLLDFLHVGLKPETLSILCYDSYGRENYFRTEASSNLEAEQSLAPESKYFPWFLGGVVGGSWDEELQFLLLLHACWVSPQKNRHRQQNRCSHLTHYQHVASA